MCEKDIPVGIIFRLMENFFGVLYLVKLPQMSSHVTCHPVASFNNTFFGLPGPSTASSLPHFCIGFT